MMEKFLIKQIIDSESALFMAELEASSGAPQPWSEQLYRNEFENNHFMAFGMYRSDTDELLAFVIFQIVFEEADISNFVVKREYQGQGRGTFLLKEAFSKLKKKGVAKVVLEVRSENLVARSVYEKLGFQVVGIRKGYYQDSGENAILMDLIL